MKRKLLIISFILTLVTIVMCGLIIFDMAQTLNEHKNNADSGFGEALGAGLLSVLMIIFAIFAAFVAISAIIKLIGIFAEKNLITVILLFFDLAVLLVPAFLFFDHVRSNALSFSTDEIILIVFTAAPLFALITDAASIATE